MMNALASPAPIQFQTLAESSRNYEPGSQFSEYVRLQQANAPQTVCPVHQFEPYNATMYVLSFIANGDCLLAFFQLERLQPPTQAFLGELVFRLSP